MSRAMILLLRLYQWGLRPILGPACRFTPSCSNYAIEALATHGAWRGAALAGGRVLRCNPWCQCGHDPVPPRRPRKPTHAEAR